MSDFNFRMLILARESRGVTQSELAKKTGTDQGFLSKIERGWSGRPSDDLLNRFAAELDYPREFFFQPDVSTPISDFFYRKRLTMSAKEKTKLEARVEVLRIVYDKLLQSVEIPEAKFPSAITHKNFTPVDIARLAREFYKVPKGPVSNLVSLVERNGVIVVFIDDVSDKFDGMTVYTNSNFPLIILNKNMTNDRKRFTICHEWAHQIMHLPYRYDFEMYERLKSDPNALEKEADAFAAEFLMPENDCRNDFTNLTYSALSHLKIYWKVSKRAIVYRAKTLNCIDDKKYKFLMIELSRMGERVRESVEVEMDEPVIGKQIFNAHFKHLGFTTKSLSNHLSIHENDLVSLVRVSSTNSLKIAI